MDGVQVGHLVFGWLGNGSTGGAGRNIDVDPKLDHQVHSSQGRTGHKPEDDDESRMALHFSPVQVKIFCLTSDLEGLKWVLWIMPSEGSKGPHWCRWHHQTA